MPCKYFCIEGIDGVGKSTQCYKLYKLFKNLKYNVVQTKEPGSSHLPITLELRKIILNDKYDSQMTPLSRELISQSVRAMHINNFIKPSLEKYDYIIQDRGILSAFSYGIENGCDLSTLKTLTEMVSPNIDYYELYDHIIVLTIDNIDTAINRAKQTNEFIDGKDVIEEKDISYFKNVYNNFYKYSTLFKKVTFVSITNKNENQVFEEIFKILLN